MNKKILINTAIGFGIVVVAVIAAVLLRPHTSGGLEPGQKLKVVAAENFWGNIASQIGGDKVTVTSVISDPSLDPHLYESSAKDASALGSAHFVIVNGLGYDDFMDKLISASPNAGRTTINVTKLTGAQAGDNPHLWYDVSRVGLVATTLATDFADKDPANITTYQANLNTFLSTLQPLYNTVNTIQTSYPQVPVAYTERVPGYLLKMLNFTVKSPAGFASAIEAGNEPTPADQAAMLALMNQKQVRILFYNAQASSPAAQAIRTAAVKNNIPVIAVTETLPASAANYQAWMQSYLDAIKNALASNI